MVAAAGCSLPVRADGAAAGSSAGGAARDEEAFTAGSAAALPGVAGDAAGSGASDGDTAGWTRRDNGVWLLKSRASAAFNASAARTVGVPGKSERDRFSVAGDTVRVVWAGTRRSLELSRGGS
jgi:hypothetical protein